MKNKLSLSRHAIFRFALPKDTNAICSLYFEWLKRENRISRIKQIRKSIRRKEIIIATVPGTHRPIGFIQWTVFSDPLNSGSIFYIISFYIKKEFRRKGIGSSLLALLLEIALNQGAAGVEVATAQRAAFKLYRKFGFSRYRGEIQEVVLGLDPRIKKNRRKFQMFLSRLERSRKR